MTEVKQIHPETVDPSTTYRIAYDTLNREISLFWQRSNYFLVLNTAIAAGIVIAERHPYWRLLPWFGLFSSLLWVAVNVGSKFWQARWEQRLARLENELNLPHRLFSESAETIRADASAGLELSNRWWINRWFYRSARGGPSVSSMMAWLSVVFVFLWVALLAWDATEAWAAWRSTSIASNSVTTTSQTADSVTWAEGTTALAAVAALVVASLAWFTSVNALRTSYRPVLRPVPLIVRATQMTNPTRFLLKNIGAGPAVSVMVFTFPTPADAQPVADHDVVEPLRDPQGGGGEVSRIGRVEIDMDRGVWLEVGQMFRVVYQDIAGGWHETRLKVLERGFEAQMLGPKRSWHLGRSIPASAKRSAQIVRASEWA